MIRINGDATIGRKKPTPIIRIVNNIIVKTKSQMPETENACFKSWYSDSKGRSSILTAYQYKGVLQPISDLRISLKKLGSIHASINFRKNVISINKIPSGIEIGTAITETLKSLIRLQ